MLRGTLMAALKGQDKLAHGNALGKEHNTDEP